MGHFSPRSLARVMSRTVMRRVPFPPYSALLPSEGLVWAAESCVIATAPYVISRRPHGVPGSPPWWHLVPVRARGSGCDRSGTEGLGKDLRYETVPYRNGAKLVGMTTAVPDSRV